MPVTRTYLCDVCEHEFKQFHMSRDEPAPDCPKCAETARQIPGLFAIKTEKSRAIDLTQQIAEQDYGLTNIRDNTREGDISVIAPPQVQTAEAEALTRQIAETAPDMQPHQKDMLNAFWKGSMGAPASAIPGAPPMDPVAQRDLLLAAGAAASAEANGLGADPIGMLHDAGKKGLANTKYEILNPPSTRSLSL